MKVIYVALILISGIAFAETTAEKTESPALLNNETVAAGDYSFRVCQLQSHTDRNSAYIRPCTPWVSQNGCAGTWLTWEMSSYQGKSMYDTALKALLEGREVTVRLNGSSCNGYDVTTMIRINL